MKTDLEVEVEVDLRPLGKVLIFRDRQTDKHFIIIYIIINIIIIITMIYVRGGHRCAPLLPISSAHCDSEPRLIMNSELPLIVARDDHHHEDGDDNDYDGASPNSHKHFFPYMGFCASIWDNVHHHCH